MPYIADWKRTVIAKAVKRRTLKTTGEVPEDAGELNYMLTLIVKGYIKKHGLSYSSIAQAVSALECAKLELYRRVATPYEDKKINDNGDVY